MKKFLSVILSLSMIFAVSVPAFAADDQVAAYTFSEDIINAEVSDDGIQPFTSENIIVMTEAEALELGTELRAIVQRVNPKFCVNSIWGANRAKFIQGGSRGIRLPPCQQHNAGGVGCQGRRSCSACP